MIRPVLGPTVTSVGTPRTVCVIVHFGDASLTSRALQSIAAGTVRPTSVVVIDNGPDPLPPGLMPEDLNTALITPGSNLGFAAGVTLAIEHSRDSEFEYAWLLNNDAVAEPGALEALLDSAQRLGGGAMVSSLILEDTGPTVWFEHARYLPWRLEGRHEASPSTGRGALIIDGAPSPWSVPYLPGCSLLIPFRLLESIGGLDPSFFLYGEDIDLCIRAQRHGWKLAIDRSSLVRHRGSSGTDPATRERLMASTSLRLTARYYPWLVPVAIPGALITGLKRAVGRRRWWWLTSRVKGYVDVVTGRARAGP